MTDNGGIVHDHRGAEVWDFSKNAKSGPVIKAGELGLFKSLVQAVSLGCSVLLEDNSASHFMVLPEEKSALKNGLFALQGFLFTFSFRLLLLLVRHSANCWADSLAKWGAFILVDF